ncbi:hypothetical protein Tcan_11143 [Toxocara canis]|uniref:Uncharacterized protein n=2 Tax=Toxocara canis TaxID=6265 RepID=A0A0B2V6N1_TOXCA|nr:hypothetical protein Tcan_11143 [Toxocara canis]VDM24734.1 unnamed protein product [Toxocara canis]
MKLLVVRDESSKILGHRWLNSQISFYIGLLQLSVCIWAMAQHLFSLITYRKILFCDFVNGTEPVLLVGVDIIIFDIGLFHSLWGIDSCVAQHLDGGYGRFGWCFFHIAAFVISLPFAFVSRPKPYSLWPLLIQQSAYGVGLLILSLAALPRVLPTFTGDRNSASLFSVSVYAAGASLNFLLLYIYWHWYWHVETMWNSARKLRGGRMIVNPNNRSKRTMMRHRESYSVNSTNIASQYDASNERAVLVDASRDGSYKASQIDEAPSVSNNTVLAGADTNNAVASESSGSLPRPSLQHRNAAIQQAKRVHDARPDKTIDISGPRRDSTRSLFAVYNDFYRIENDSTPCEPTIKSNGVSRVAKAASSNIRNGSLMSAQAFYQRQPCECDGHGSRKPRRLLPSCHLFSSPINRYATSSQRQLIRPSPVPLRPLRVAEAEFISSAQPMLQYSPIRYFRL